MNPFSQLRSEFPIFQKHKLVYLDSAATTHKPKSVLDTMQRFYEEQYATVHRAVYSLAGQSTALYASVREKAQAFLNATSPEEIIFTKGTTDAINLVASSFGRAFLHAGDEVIISQMEHHSNIVPWQVLCQEKGATLKIIPIHDSAELDLDAFEQLLTERTKIVSLAHVANATGTQNPIETIIEKAHKKGAKVFIDGAQSAAHLPVDLRALDADFYAFSGHKAFGPTGIGILYGKKELLEKMPPYQYGSDMIQEVTLHTATFQSPPLRFETGTPPIAEVIGLGAALDYIQTLGRESIAAWEQTLLRHATHQLEQIPGLRILGTAPVKGPILTFTVEGVHPLDIGTLLDTRGIAVRTGHLCAQPTMRRFGVTSATRLSFAPYNTLEEIDLFASALQEILSTTLATR